MIKNINNDQYGIIKNLYNIFNLIIMNTKFTTQSYIIIYNFISGNSPNNIYFNKNNNKYSIIKTFYNKLYNKYFY